MLLGVKKTEQELSKFSKCCSGAGVGEEREKWKEDRGERGEKGRERRE